MALSVVVADRLLHASDASRRRPSQIAFAESAAAACLAGNNAVLHAPTGIGKTRALLAAGVQYVLAAQGNKVVYGVRTLGQLFHVDSEYRAGWAAFVDGSEKGANAVRFGLALGVHPMQSKVCSVSIADLAGRELNHKCEGCPRQAARHSPCRVQGGCTSADYKDAATRGLCPYSYMRENLSSSNLIVASTGYVNSRDNMRRVFADEAEQERAVLFVDEAHSYLDALATRPMLHLGFSSGSSLESVRQPESDLDLKKVREEYVRRAAGE